MAKKNRLHFIFDSPVTIILAAVSIAVFALDSLIFKGKLINSVFVCKGCTSYENLAAFNFSSAKDYLALVLHIFGSTGWMALLTSSVFLMLIGPQMEERYGSLIFALMIFITSLVSGVLTACFVRGGNTGNASLIFMLILLSAITAFIKKQIPVSSLLVFITFLALRILGSDRLPVKPAYSGKFVSFFSSNMATFADLIAGIVGSLFAFLVAPKKARAAKKSDSKTEINISKEPTEYYSTYNSYSSQNKKDTDNNETVIGSIEL